MIARAPAAKIAAQWRKRFSSITAERVSGVLVKKTLTRGDFEACQYVACTDSLRMVIVAGSGAVAAYKSGEFRGWHPSVDIAVATLTGR